MSCKPVTPERLAKMAYLWDDTNAKTERMIEDRGRPNFQTMLKVITESMESHPWWSRLEGTPLANDLPVRAAVAAMKAISKR